jgi:predicted lipoprotein with Yx(FWY)xxD motif
MKTALAWILVIIILAGGAWFYLTQQKVTPTPQTIEETGTPGPSNAMGINGSPNQGNMGQPDNGVVQQPMADGAEGSIIGSNLALGLDSTATLGKYLIAYNGMTLYTYSKDTGSTSTCYDQCAVNWPPYIVGPEDNIQQLKAGVTGKVDTTTRTDGKIQVTYNGHPLYFYIKDTKSGDTTGQNVGGVWFVVKP